MSPPASPSKLPLLLIPTALEAASLLADGKTPLGPPEPRQLGGRPVAVGLAGLGPIAAAAVAAHWIARLHPTRVLLVGTAGSYDLQRAPVRSVVQATVMHCDGLGVGEGEEHRALAFPQLPGMPDGGVVDRLPLPEQTALHGATPGEVLTAPTSSSGPEQVARRRARRPDCLVEEMEGFAVALACHLAGVPLTVLRGVSNLAGDRDPRRWRIDEAMQAARPMLHQWLEPAP